MSMASKGLELRMTEFYVAFTVCRISRSKSSFHKEKFGESVFGESENVFYKIYKGDHYCYL